MTMVPDCPVEKQFWSISGVGLVNTYARLYLRCSYNMGHLALTGTNDKHFKDPGFGGGGGKYLCKAILKL